MGALRVHRASFPPVRLEKCTHGTGPNRSPRASACHPISAAAAAARSHLMDKSAARVWTLFGSELLETVGSLLAERYNLGPIWGRGTDRFSLGSQSTRFTQKFVGLGIWIPRIQRS